MSSCVEQISHTTYKKEINARLQVVSMNACPSLGCMYMYMYKYVYVYMYIDVPVGCVGMCAHVHVHVHVLYM